MFDRQQVRKATAELAARNISIGTSSWKYPGWLGKIYDPARYEYRGKFAKKRFETECLGEYAEVFPTVCVDAGYYRFPNESYITKLADQTTEGFRLSFKVTDEITIKRFPRHDRHGERAGMENKNFLNANLFINEFLGPCSARKEKIGVIMFEFSRFYTRDFPQGRDFVKALDEFLGKLPTGWQYGVELRNPVFLRPEYFQMLAGHGVTHVFNSWTEMPDVIEQMAMEGSFTTDFFAARFLLKPGRNFEDAVKTFSPYDSVKISYPAARRAIRELAQKKPKKRSYIFVNNRLEGNSLQTIEEVLKEREDASLRP